MISSPRITRTQPDNDRDCDRECLHVSEAAGADSPLVRDIVASPPTAGVQKHLALILPDTDTSSVNKMMDTTTTDTREIRVRNIH